MTWAEEMLAALEAPAAWSRARTRAEWAQVWQGPTGFAITRNNNVVRVERKRRIWKEAA
jgi:hypothetical protein